MKKQTHPALLHSRQMKGVAQQKKRKKRVEKKERCVQEEKRKTRVETKMEDVCRTGRKKERLAYKTYNGDLIL